MHSAKTATIFFAVKCFDLYKQYKNLTKSFLLLYRRFCEVKTANSLYDARVKGLNPHELAHKWMKDLGATQI